MNESSIIIPKDLCKAILGRIEQEQKHAARVRFALLSCLSALSLSAAIPTLLALIDSFTRSGFYDYLSLIVTDNALVLASKDLMFSLVESLPLLTLAAFLAVLAVFIWSSMKAIRSARVALLKA